MRVPLADRLEPVTSAPGSPSTSSSTSPSVMPFERYETTIRPSANACSISRRAWLCRPSAPNIKRVDSGESALEALSESKYELVIVLRTLTDIEWAEFSRKAKMRSPDIPIVLLAFHHRELEQVREKVKAAFDNIFIWNGESKMLLTIIKLVEDQRNAEADTDQVGVRVIILVENSVRFYSSYLPLMYSEIMRQASALLTESINATTRRVRMRARPKILLAESFEEALDLFSKYRRYLLGVVSDIQFPRGGESDESAGIELAKQMKAEAPDLPILLQSSDQGKTGAAEACDAGFLNKQSPKLLKKLSRFINENFGFGDFVFKNKKGKKLAVAHNMRSFEQHLKTIPEESLIYHASRDHFSMWLLARGEIRAASIIPT